MPLILANALVPIFAGLLVGYIAGRRRVVDNVNVRSLVTFLMSFALPCALFSIIARTPRVQLYGQGLAALVISLVYLAVYAIVYSGYRRFARHSPHDSAVLALTLGLPNVTAVGLPLLLSAYGPAASVTTAVSIAMGSLTVAPITLAVLETRPSPTRPLRWRERLRSAFAPTPAGRQPDTFLGILWRACRRPVVWAPAAGILYALAGLPALPSYIDRSLTVMGSATVGTALFLTGLVVSEHRIEFNRAVGLLLALKNLAQPALALGACLLFHLSADLTRSVVLLCAIPCGFFGLVFGKNFNCTPPDASSTLVSSYIFGVPTLALWILLLNHLRLH